MDMTEKAQKDDCAKEKMSARTVGIIILFLSSLLALAGLLILPVIGLFFAAPLFILGLTFILAPESRACRLLLGKK